MARRYGLKNGKKKVYSFEILKTVIDKENFHYNSYELKSVPHFIH